MTTPNLSSSPKSIDTVSADALDAFRQIFQGPVLQPGDDGYDDARRVWNAMIDRRPGLIARCTGTADVIDVVNFAREHDLLLSVKGGGHNATGNATNDGGLMIDLSLMKGIHVDPAHRMARAQPGVLWGELDRETQLFGLATPGGVISTTGIAGLTLGGGLGWLRRTHGLSCDNLLSVDIVTADGQLRHASAEENTDLFWAVRGGGGNFGIVTSFEFQLHPVGPEVMFCSLMYPVDDAATIIGAWRDFYEAAPEEVNSICAIWSVPQVAPIPRELWGKPIVMVSALYLGSVEVGKRVLQPLRELATPVLDLSGQTQFTAVQKRLDPFFPSFKKRFYLKSTGLNSLDDSVIQAIAARAVERPSDPTLVVIWPYGGAIRRVGVTDTAFAGRQIPYLLSIDGTWEEPELDERVINWVRQFITDMQPYSSGQSYSNFSGDQERAQALYGPNYERLVALKNKYDPSNLFRLNQNIQPTV